MRATRTRPPEVPGERASSLWTIERRSVALVVGRVTQLLPAPSPFRPAPVLSLQEGVRTLQALRGMADSSRLVARCNTARETPFRAAPPRWRVSATCGFSRVYEKWSGGDSNSRPLACKASALPVELPPRSSSAAHRSAGRGTQVAAPEEDDRESNPTPPSASMRPGAGGIAASPAPCFGRRPRVMSRSRARRSSRIVSMTEAR